VLNSKPAAYERIQYTHIKEWLAVNWDNMSELSNMSIRLLFHYQNQNKGNNKFTELRTIF